MTEKAIVLRNYINGQWIESKTGEFAEVRNSATDEVIALCPMSSREEADMAVGAAREAFWNWRTTPVPERVEYMFALRQKMVEHKQELAGIISSEHGKLHREALDELTRTLQYVEDACTVTQTMKGSFTEDIAHGVDEYFIREPLGVFLVLPPFNFPSMIPMYFVWAIATGNTVVIKSSSICPMTIQRITELAEECGFPKGVINLVHGSGGGVGDYLVTHPDIVGVSFVGSSKVGLDIYRMATNSGKRAQVQGGAKNHAVVMEDAEIDEAIKNVISSCFGHIGERCFAVSNVLVAEEVYDEFKEKFLAAARELKVGPSSDNEAKLGPVVSKKHLGKLLEEIEHGVQEGAKLIMDGRGVKVEGYPNGYFLGATIFEAEPGMHVFEEEIFGPVRCLKKFSDLDEAIRIIEQNPYGHTAVIYTESGAYAREFIQRCEVGQIGVNIGTPAPIGFYPVGGRKLSFYGSSRGRANDAIDFYTDKKVVVSRWLKRKAAKSSGTGVPVNW